MVNWFSRRMPFNGERIIFLTNRLWQLYAVLYLVSKPCPTLCNPVDSSRPVSSVHEDSPGEDTGVGGMPSSRRSSRPRDGTQLSHTAGRFFLPFEPPGSQLCINMQTNEVRPPASQHTWQMIIALITVYHVWQVALQFWSSKSSISVPGLKASCPQGWSQEEAPGDSLFFAFFPILAAICIPWLLAASPTFTANSVASFDLLPSLPLLLLA